MSTTQQLQSSGMLSREQLIYLFDRFGYLTSLPDVKKRIADAVSDNQEAVAVTTAIQEEIFLEMGVDPGFGISCLGKVNSSYKTDQDLMIQFYKFVANFSLIGKKLPVMKLSLGQMSLLKECTINKNCMSSSLRC